MQPDLVGSTLGRYHISAVIGRGGMATVYRAEDPKLSRDVAVKVLHPHLATDPSFGARFLQEARAVAALRHPHIVQVYDFGDQDGLTYMVMELIEGPSLAEAMARRAGDATPSRGVVALASAIGSAVDYAAGLGMIHRDIKPANILFDRGDRPVLADYGIARVLGATSHTIPGLVVGSAHYMSPEQAQGLTLDARSDLYSLAVVLFEALTGQVPFDGDSTGAILLQHITRAVPSARTVNPTLPAGVDAVFAKALAKDPDDRYPTGADVAAALGAALPGTVPASAGPRRETRVEAPAVRADAAAPMMPVATGAPPTRATSPSAPSTGAPPRPRPPDRAHPSRRRQASEGRRLPARWALAAAGAAVVLGLVWVLVLAGGGGDEPADTIGTTTLTGEEVGTAEEQALLAEADSLLQRGQLDEAAVRYTAILQPNPSFAPARRQLGIVYYMLPGAEHQAATQLRTASEALPGDSTVAAFLGAAIFAEQRSQRLTDFAEAEQWLRTAAERDPDNALAHAFLAKILVATGREDEALAEAAKGLELDPNSPWTHAAEGFVHAFLDEWDRSVESHRAAVLLNPAWPNLYPGLIEALTRVGSYDEALEYSTTLQGLDQGYVAEALRLKGFTLAQAGDPQGAVEAFTQSLALDDTDDYTEWGLGSLLYRQGDYAGALPHLQRAAALAPAAAGYHAWVASCLLELERYDEARTAAETALGLDPDNTDAQQVLDQVSAKGA